jgi:outer membrane protein OmpU
MNIKKIGLTALAASLVSVSANAGEMTVAGSAKMNATGHSGEGRNLGTSFTMGNQLTFSGSGELDNGLTVSLSFIQDNGESTFDSHSVTIASDSFGTLKMNGEGGTTASNNIDKMASGDLWDAFDGLATSVGKDDNSVTFSTDLAQTASSGDNSFFYTAPATIDGVGLFVSYQPQGSGRESGMGYGVNYTGVEGLTVKYAVSDVIGTDNDSTGDNTVMYASYAYGPVTVSVSTMEHDENKTDNTNDVDTDAMAISYSITDDLSVTYGSEEHDKGGQTVGAELEGISFSYTAGGMTISGSMKDGKNLDHSTSTAADVEQWTVGASFAF